MGSFLKFSIFRKFWFIFVSDCTVFILVPLPSRAPWSACTPALTAANADVDRRYLAGGEVSGDAIFSDVTLSLPRTPWWHTLTP
jgi:hypothetical protein